jgi:simple sugar transport system ATP-binding protein
VGASEYVRSTLIARARAGAGVLLVSEDLDELLAVADRLVVMYEGRIVGAMSTMGADIDRLGMLMAGRTDDSLVAHAMTAEQPATTGGPGSPG